MKLESYLTLYTKINSKWIKDLNVRAKTIRLLEENTSVNLYNLQLGNGFLYMTPKAHASEEKIDKLDFNKIKKDYKGHYQECEKTTHRMG